VAIRREGLTDGRFRGNVHVSGGNAHVSEGAARVARALGLTAQHRDAEFVIHTLASPAGGGGVVVDVDAQGRVRHPCRRSNSAINLSQR
jgi:hypothetical protein